MLILTYGGMAALCLAMNRHYRQVRFAAPAPRLKLTLRVLGSALLIIALLLGISGWGVTIGPVVWFGVLSVSALTLIFLLPYRPRLVMKSGLLATPVALLGVLLLVAL